MKTSRVHVATTPVDSPTRVAWRFLVGQDLNGGYKTDHKWAKRGTKITSANGRATRWAHLPMRRRSGVRLLGLGVVLCLLVGPFISIAGYVQTLRVVVWLALLAFAWISYERSRKFALRRERDAPLCAALAQRIGDSRYIHDPREWVSIPVDVQDGTTMVYLPIDYSPGVVQEKALARMVAKKIGLLNPTSTFVMQGERPYLELVPAPAPRDLVDFADPEIATLVERSKEGRLFLGLGPRDDPAFLDLDTQAPHIGMSIATGGGKSTTARGLIMQHLHNGGIALILDPKMDSQLWARELPNVRYADTAQEIHEALLWLSDELDRRSEVTKEHADIRGDVDPKLVGPRLMVVGEEINTLEIDLMRYWRTIRDPRNDPIKPVSLSALGRSLNMGRARRINALLIAQELLVQSIGGPAAKTNLSTRILGRANTPTWNKLAPECKVNGRYPRKVMNPRGRVYLVVTDEPMPVQCMTVDEQTAIDYSTSGVVSTFPVVGVGSVNARDSYSQKTGSGPSPLPPLFDAFEDDDDLDEPDALSIDESAEVCTLTDAAERLALDVRTLRRAHERGWHGFPEPVETPTGKANLYNFAELEKWAIGRSAGGDAS